jgi:hypothetical protein
MMAKKKAVSPLKRSKVFLPAKKQVIKSNTQQIKTNTPVGTIATKRIHKADEEENSYKEIDESGQGVLIGDVGDWDEEDFLRVENKVDGKPVYDMTQEELLAVSDTRRVRKPTDHMAPPVFSVRLTDVRNKKTCAIQVDDKWWIGPHKPIMPGLGETNPLYAEQFWVDDGYSWVDFASDQLTENDENPPAAYQTDFATCKAYVNASLGRADTTEELDAKCEELQTTDACLAVRKWTKETENAVQKEINLLLLTNDVRLKYIPIVSNRDSKFANKERGRYEALVHVKEKSSQFFGKTLLYCPANDWVEDNFTEESLAIVQEVARETRKV